MKKVTCFIGCILMVLSVTAAGAEVKTRIPL